MTKEMEKASVFDKSGKDITKEVKLISITDWRGQIMAIDENNWIYKFVIGENGYEGWQKKKEEQGDDMIREYPSFPKEAFDIAIK